jgi:hypothetical protein
MENTQLVIQQSTTKDNLADESLESLALRAHVVAILRTAFERRLEDMVDHAVDSLHLHLKNVSGKLDDKFDEFIDDELEDV